MTVMQTGGYTFTLLVVILYNPFCSEFSQCFFNPTQYCLSFGLREILNKTKAQKIRKKETKTLSLLFFSFLSLFRPLLLSPRPYQHNIFFHSFYTERKKGLEAENKARERDIKTSSISLVWEGCVFSLSLLTQHFINLSY